MARQTSPIARQPGEPGLKGAHPLASDAANTLLPLLPMQHWFFERIQVAPQHWNHSELYRIAHSLDYGVLERALGYLMRHHPALRLTFERTSRGWRQRIARVRNDPPLDWYDLSYSRGKDLQQAIHLLACRLNGQLSLDRDPLLRVVLIRTAPEEAERLLLISHQLVLDNRSRRQLLCDLAQVYQQLSAGNPVCLPPQTTTLPARLQSLQQQLKARPLQTERHYWQQLLAAASVQLPVDQPPDLQNNNQRDCRQLRLYLDTGATRKLCRMALLEARKSGAGGQRSLSPLLLRLLAAPLLQWTGGSSLLIDTRINNYLPPVIHPPLGWFEDIRPVQLTRSPADDASPTTGDDNSNYGLLREMAPPLLAAPLRQAPLAQFCFTNRDDLAGRGCLPPLLALEDPHCGAPCNPHGLRPYLVELEIGISAGRLCTQWRYGRHFHHHVTIERLAVAFMAAIQQHLGHHDGSPPATPPDDLPLAADQPLSSMLKDIDDDLLFE